MAKRIREDFYAVRNQRDKMINDIEVFTRKYLEFENNEEKCHFIISFHNLHCNKKNRLCEKCFCAEEDEIDKLIIDKKNGKLVHKLCVETIECSICLEKKQITETKLNCGHVFCKKCIIDWRTSNNENNDKCPNCRVKITKIETV